MEPGDFCPHQCDCPCHEKDMVAMHFMPCCEGKCKICNRNIKTGMMDEHLRDCHGKE